MYMKIWGDGTTGFLEQIEKSEKMINHRSFVKNNNT